MMKKKIDKDTRKLSSKLKYQKRKNGLNITLITKKNSETEICNLK